MVKKKISPLFHLGKNVYVGDRLDCIMNGEKMSCSIRTMDKGRKLETKEELSDIDTLEFPTSRQNIAFDDLTSVAPWEKRATVSDHVCFIHTTPKSKHFDQYKGIMCFRTEEEAKNAIKVIKK